MVQLRAEGTQEMVSGETRTGDAGKLGRVRALRFARGVAGKAEDEGGQDQSRKSFWSPAEAWALEGRPWKG